MNDEALKEVIRGVLIHMGMGTGREHDDYYPIPHDCPQCGSDLEKGIYLHFVRCSNTECDYETSLKELLEDG